MTECVKTNTQKTEGERKMAGRIEVKGVIGNSNNMKPTCIWQTRERNGKYTKVPFMTFRMWAENYTKAMITGEDGTKRRARDVVQIILPETERGQNLFKLLAGGRRVIVRGRLTHRPNEVLDAKKLEAALDNYRQHKDLETCNNEILQAITSYPNPVIYLDSLEFMDEPPLLVAQRLLNTLQTECNEINDEQNAQYYAAIKKHFDTMRTEVNERNVRGTTQENLNDEIDDPDQMDLL